MTHAGLPMSTTLWVKAFNILTSIVEQLTNDSSIKLFESREELLEGNNNNNNNNNNYNYNYN